MAVDDQMTCSTDSSTSSASISANRLRRQRLIQVATTNSSTFIRFPSNRRQSTSIVPMFHATSTRLSSPITDTYSSSNHSAKVSIHEHSRSHSQQRSNPILNNPLLNHRKEQVKFPPMKPNSRPSLSSQPLKTLSNAPRRASATPDLPVEPPVSYLNEEKIDYIQRWLEQIRSVTQALETKV